MKPHGRRAALALEPLEIFHQRTNKARPFRLRIIAGFDIAGHGAPAPALGMLVSLSPVEASVSAGFFILILLSSGYVSLGSVIASFVFPMTMFVRENIFKVEIYGYKTLIFFSIAVSIFLIYNHRSNIKRLLYGNESRFEKLWKIRFFYIKAPLGKK